MGGLEGRETEASKSRGCLWRGESRGVVGPGEGRKEL